MLADGNHQYLNCSKPPETDGSIVTLLIKQIKFEAHLGHSIPNRHDKMGKDTLHLAIRLNFAQGATGNPEQVNANIGLIQPTIIEICIVPGILPTLESKFAIFTLNTSVPHSARQCWQVYASSLY